MDWPKGNNKYTWSKWTTEIQAKNMVDLPPHPAPSKAFQFVAQWFDPHIKLNELCS